MRLTCTDDQFRLPFLLEVRPPAEFSYDAAASKLVNLRLDAYHASQVRFFVPGDTVVEDPTCDFESARGQQGKLLLLAGLVDMDSRLTVRMGFRQYLEKTNCQ
jgi:DNA mismatch repair protein MSH5